MMEFCSLSPIGNEVLNRAEEVVWRESVSKSVHAVNEIIRVGLSQSWPGSAGSGMEADLPTAVTLHKEASSNYTLLLIASYSS